jgi:transcriptional regulator of heat shock response
MEITERQKLILDKLIEEYISSAQPVSSQALEEKYNFGFSPATIRSEMYKLTESGYLLQPHTSAGRIPSDKGYRFFVNNLLQEKREKPVHNVSDKSEDFTEGDDEIKILQSITKDLADSSSALAFTFSDNVFWKDGWNRVFREPEFRETDMLETFTNFLDDFEKDIQDFELGSGIKVFIGKENPFNNIKDFSIIISQCEFPKNEKGFLGIVGPKRMAYEKSIDSINNLKEILKRL